MLAGGQVAFFTEKILRLPRLFPGGNDNCRMAVVFRDNEAARCTHILLLLFVSFRVILLSCAGNRADLLLGKFS